MTYLCFTQIKTWSQHFVFDYFLPTHNGLTVRRSVWEEQPQPFEELCWKNLVKLKLGNKIEIITSRSLQKERKKKSACFFDSLLSLFAFVFQPRNKAKTHPKINCAELHKLDPVVFHLQPRPASVNLILKKSEATSSVDQDWFRIMTYIVYSSASSKRVIQTNNTKALFNMDYIKKKISNQSIFLENKQRRKRLASKTGAVTWLASSTSGEKTPVARSCLPR